MQSTIITTTPQTGSRLATVFSIVCGFPLMFAGLKTGFFSLWRASVEESTRLGPKAKRVSGHIYTYTYMCVYFK